jgi:hypothetical protein
LSVLQSLRRKASGVNRRRQTRPGGILHTRLQAESRRDIVALDDADIGKLAIEMPRIDTRVANKEFIT